MKNNNSIPQGILRAGIALLMVSGAAYASAQDASAEEAQPKKAKVERPAPKYETKEVSGYVYDAATKKPLDAASIQAFGNNRYTVMTDENGKFSIKVPVFVTSLYISVPEYNSVQVAIDGNKTPDVALYPAVFTSAYQKQTTITSAAKTELRNTSAVTVDDEIDNSLSGDIHTINRTGMRGQGVAMFIRGINSLNINAQPLIILDGMMIDTQIDRSAIHDGFFNNILAGIDPDDIESVEVLKNATSLYGARGANGVILINTKRGHSQATRIDVSLNTGFELAPSYTSMMNGSQYRNYVSDIIGTTKYGQEHSTAANAIPFLNSNPDYYWYPLYHNDNDWSDALYRTAVTQNYKVGVQGGDDIAMYNLSLGYANSQSTACNNAFDRLNIRFNTDIKLAKGLDTQLDLSYSKFSYNLRDNGWAESYASSTVSSPNVLGLIQAPFLSKYGYYTGEDGRLHESSVFAGKYLTDPNNPFGFASSYGTNTALANPYWILENGEAANKNSQEVTQFNLNIMPKWEINSHLTLTNRFAYQLNRSNEKYFLPEAGTPKYNLEGFGDVTSVIKSLFSKETSIYEDFRIDWKNVYGGIHDINVFGGMRFTSNSFSDSRMSGYNAGNDKMPDFRNSNAFRSVPGIQNQWKNLAYYLQADYNYKHIYYLQATVSAETSSRFGKEAAGGLRMCGVSWGMFPSIQAGWVLTNEKWFRKSNAINYLKLTAGYDISGNDNFDYDLSRTYFKSFTYLKNATALQLANIENPAIQWETTHNFNVALNGSFLNNRLQAGVDFYVRNTNNLITYKTINYMSGLKGYYTNDGSLRNVGVDAKVTAIIANTKDFTFQLGASLGHYKNAITALPEGDYTQKIYGAEVLTSLNNPAGVFYGFKTAGVFASDAEASKAHKGSDYLKYPTGIATAPYKNFNAGDVHFVDNNGDGVIDNSDKTIIGDPNPDIFGNIFANLTFCKHWSLDINFKYSLGGDIYNYQRSRLESANGFINQTTAVVNRWRNEGQVTDMPRAMAADSEDWVNNERFSDRWIEDGSFLKLKKVRLSYQLPLALSWIQGLTIWAEGNNLITLSRYTGADPEFSCGNGVMYQGIDAGLLPSNRSFNIGVKINL